MSKKIHCSPEYDKYLPDHIPLFDYTASSQTKVNTFAYNLGTMKLSVVIPVYNEAQSIQEILKRVQDTQIPWEIIVVDDGSQDGTREILQQMDGQNGIRVILHERNQGKGAAVRTALNAARGDVILIQDADLEYDPRDYPVLLRPIEEGVADVVYGSRFLGGPRRVVMFWHMVANFLLTLMTNILYNTILSDMETGYKVFRREVVEGMPLHARRFDFEPEFTAKVLKRHYRIFEVPISFNPRDYSEGKKIKLKDAFEAVWTLLKYRFVD
jgi:glycosyltransferase involved in cell wall biosynthesis